MNLFQRREQQLFQDSGGKYCDSARTSGMKGEWGRSYLNERLFFYFRYLTCMMYLNENEKWKERKKGKKQKITTQSKTLFVSILSQTHLPFNLSTSRLDRRSELANSHI